MKEATRRLPRPEGFARAPKNLPLLARVPHEQQQQETAESRLKRMKENQEVPCTPASLGTAGVYLPQTAEGGQLEEHAPYAVPKAAPVTATLAVERKGICIDDSDDDEQNERKRPRQDGRVESTPAKKTRPDPRPPMSSNPTESPAAVAQAPRPIDKPENEESLNGHAHHVGQIAYSESMSKHQELLAQREKEMKEEFDKKAQQPALQDQDEIRDLKRQVKAQQAAFRQPNEIRSAEGRTRREKKRISALKEQISTLKGETKRLTERLGEASAKNRFCELSFKFVMTWTPTPVKKEGLSV